MKKTLNKIGNKMIELKKEVTIALVSGFLPLYNYSVVYASNGMDFFTKGVDIMQMILVGIGAVILIMGIINFLESYANDNPASKSQGQKQFIAGAGIIIVSILLIPELKTLITAA